MQCDDPVLVLYERLSRINDRVGAALDADTPGPELMELLNEHRTVMTDLEKQKPHMRQMPTRSPPAWQLPNGCRPRWQTYRNGWCRNDSPWSGNGKKAFTPVRPLTHMKEKSKKGILAKGCQKQN